jgi:hypothetical protein
LIDMHIKFGFAFSDDIFLFLYYNQLVSSIKT